MSLPDFLGIGAQKAATKWLYQMLQQHPGVWMPPLKELHFFNRIGSDDQVMRQRHRLLAKKHLSRVSRDSRYAELKSYLDRVTAPPHISADWYRDLFSWPTEENVIKGEITPAYLEIDESGVRYAREFLGPVKIMLIVRRPLDRELSQIRMWASRNGDPSAWSLEQWETFYRKMADKGSRGAYSNITLWTDAMGQDNVFAMPFGDIRDRPDVLMTQVEDFLGIARFGGYQSLEDSVHKSKKVEIPKEIIERVGERVAAEDDFLKAHFGEEFFARTK